jgi:hypothetical protein
MNIGFQVYRNLVLGFQLFEVSRFLGRFQGLKESKYRGFFESRFQSFEGFEDSKNEGF